MNKEEALKKINESDNDDFQIFDTNEYQNVLDNYAKSKIEDAQSEVTKSIHNQYDEDLYNIFGERKSTNEKTYNFLKRKYEDLSNKSKESEPLRKKIEQLEKDLQENAGDKQIKKDLEDLRQKFQKEKESWETKETELSKTLMRNRLNNEFDKAMIGFKFKKDIPDAVRDTFVEKVKGALSGSAEFVDGNLVFRDADGKTVTNDKFEPITAKDLLSKELESILSNEKKIDGVPKVEEGEDEEGNPVLKVVNPNAKSREEVTKYLREAGIAKGTPEYNKHYKEFTKHIKPLE